MKCRTKFSKLDGFFLEKGMKATDVIDKVAPFKAGHTNINLCTDQQYFLRTRERFSETQPPKIVHNDQTEAKRLKQDMAKMPVASFEAFDAEYMMNYQFRDKTKSKWINKMTFVCPTKDVPEKERVSMLRDTPYEDGIENMRVAHYRVRHPLKERSSKPFAAVSRT